jgi:hypothetical protein
VLGLAGNDGGIFSGDYWELFGENYLEKCVIFSGRFRNQIMGFLEYLIFLIPINKIRLRELFNIHNGPLDRYHLFI